ncbi:mechanosensitive ion channel family protein [Aquipuribacter sp. MA13-6]|uniref:mechanosensitive ion channel family protein n=1 Tax=unclassified Aquipuribacter TaxID=2635084 RepID=UPI003EEED6B6
MAATNPLTSTVEPEPGDTPSTPVTDGIARVVTEQNCGTQDASLCGLINNVIGDIEQARFVSGLISIPLFVLAVVVVAFVLRYVLHRVIRRFVDRIKADDPARRGRIDLFEPTDPISRARKVQRAKAIGSILQAVVSIAVWTAAVFVILPTLGVNITGLVAGAGIVGIALGFGAQTLVQDFVSGIFMIAEDQYGVGDVIDMGEATGVVEAVGLRTTRLRAVDGTVWHVRNGEVVRVGNMSQGWSRAVLDIDVAYGEDLTQVMETLKELGHDMRSDPDWGDKFLDEPEVWGVEALAADGITVRMIIKTVPLEQWVVAREMRRRIKYRFDTLGIEIPFPQRTVWVRTEGPGAHDEGPEGGSDIPPAPQSTRGEAYVAAEDAPEPGSGEPFGSSDEPPRDQRR